MARLDDDRLARYKSLSDRMKNRNNDDSLFWRPRECEDVDDTGNRIHLLPITGWPDAFISVPIHKLMVAGKDFPKQFACPRPVGLPCPVCDLLDELGPRPTTADLKQIKKDLGLKDQLWSLITDLEIEGENVKLWPYGQTVFRQLFALISNPDWPELSDLVGGPQLYVKRTGKKLDTEYSVTPRPVAGLEDRDIGATMELANAVELMAAFCYETAETLNAALDGTYDPEKAKKLRHERDQAGKGPRRIAGVPEGMTEAEFDTLAKRTDEQVARMIGAVASKVVAKARGEAPPKPATTPPPPAAAPPPAADDLEVGEHEGEFAFGANLVGRHITFEGDGGTTIKATITAFVDGEGYDATDEAGEVWGMPDTGYFTLMPEEPPPAPEPAKKTPKPKPAQGAAPTPPAVAAPTAQSGAAISAAARERVAQLRKASKGGGA